MGAPGADPDAGGHPAGAGGRPGGPRGWSVVMPVAVWDAARRAFDARPVDASVADLVFDSLLDVDRNAGADPGVRTLRFGGRDGGAALRVTEAGDRLRLAVQALPPQRAAIEVRSPATAFALDTDEDGRVEFEMTPGLVSLVLRPLRSARSQTLQTAWLPL